jgi:hypothetical protein
MQRGKGTSHQLFTLIIVFDRILALTILGETTARLCNTSVGQTIESDNNTTSDMLLLNGNPKVNITILTSETNGKSKSNIFANETFAVLPNEDIYIALLCIASYPIEWIEVYGEVSIFTLINTKICQIFSG